MFRVRVGWEHTHREALPAILLLRALRDRGFDATLQHVHALASGRPTRDEIVLLPFYYDDSDLARYLHAVRLDRSVLVNLAYEQMHLACGRAYLLPDGELAHESMVHCAWGPRFAELLGAHGVREDRIRMTGHLRFDVYHHPSLLFDREELAARYGLRADRKWVLIPGSFNLAYIDEALRRSLNDRKYEVSRDLIAATADARDAFLELVRDLADAHPDVEIIFRVHPAGYESEGVYAGAATRRKNLHVISQYDIANWITQAALVVVWTSTSAMEALVAGVPVVSYEPAPYFERFDYDVGRIIPTLRTATEVSDLVGAGVVGARAPDLAYDWSRFERWYASRDGTACLRLVDVVAEIAGDYGAYRAQSPAQAAARLAGIRTHAVQRVRGGLRRAFRKNRTHAAPPPAALEEAVETISARPLLDYLR